MPISTEPTTFDFACNWLVSSETFVRDAMGSTAVDLDTARDEARARIFEEEALDVAEVAAESETAPDAAPSINPRPRAIVITDTNDREMVGTGTWAGSGNLMIDIEVPVPQAYLYDAEDDDDTRNQKFKDRREWARQLWTTIRDELLETSGRGDEQGNPYLNARKILGKPPADPEFEESQDWLGWTFEVPWRG